MPHTAACGACVSGPAAAMSKSSARAGKARQGSADKRVRRATAARHRTTQALARAKTRREGAAREQKFAQLRRAAAAGAPDAPLAAPEWPMYAKPPRGLARAARCVSARTRGRGRGTPEAFKATLALHAAAHARAKAKFRRRVRQRGVQPCSGRARGGRRCLRAAGASQLPERTRCPMRTGRGCARQRRGARAVKHGAREQEHEDCGGRGDEPRVERVQHSDGRQEHVDAHGYAQHAAHRDLHAVARRLAGRLPVQRLRDGILRLRRRRKLLVRVATSKRGLRHGVRGLRGLGHGQLRRRRVHVCARAARLGLLHGRRRQRAGEGGGACAHLGNTRRAQRRRSSSQLQRPTCAALRLQQARHGGHQGGGDADAGADGGSCSRQGCSHDPVRGARCAAGGGARDTRRAAGRGAACARTRRRRVFAAGAGRARPHRATPPRHLCRRRRQRCGGAARGPVCGCAPHDTAAWRGTARGVAEARRGPPPGRCVGCMWHAPPGGSRRLTRSAARSRGAAGTRLRRFSALRRLRPWRWSWRRARVARCC
jgi:hypothetical protein